MGRWGRGRGRAGPVGGLRQAPVVCRAAFQGQGRWDLGRVRAGHAVQLHTWNTEGLRSRPRPRRWERRRGCPATSPGEWRGDGALCPPGRPVSGAEDGAWRGRRGRGQGPRPRGMFQKETSITRHLNPSVPHGKAATGPPGPSASRASKRLGVTRTTSTCQDPAPSLPRASLSGSNDAPRDRPPWTGRTMTA